MPLNRHYGGHGEQVAKTMQKQYGADWQRVFYATENKQQGDRKKAALHVALRKGASK